MKKRIVIIGLALMGLVTIFVMRHIFTVSGIVARPVRLVITGPEGQRFSGSFVADGVSNSVSAAAPATIGLQAKDVAFEFRREGGDAEFRVALFVGDMCRTSSTSDQRHGVRGALRCAADGERYWATPF